MATVSSTTSATPSAAAVTSSQTSSSVDRSGLSVDDVVTAKVQPYLDKIDAINTTVTSNQAKVTAYQDMQQLLTNLQNAVDALRDPANSSTDVFNQRSATLTSSDTSVSASNLMSVTVDPGTDAASHTVTVSQLASAERLSSNSVTSRTTALGESGTFSIGESGKTAANVTITADMSLNDIVTAINNNKSTTGVTASVVAISGSNYKLVLTGADTNQTINMSTSSGTALSDLGVTQSDGSTAANVLQQAQPALLTVDGVSGIERDTNTVDDVIDGVTMNLTEADAGATVTVAIGNDTSSVSSAIQTFAESYNAWREFVSQNQATNTDGTASTSATLFGDSTLRSVSTDIDSALTSIVGSTSLGAIGISVNANNELDIDTATLMTALSTNFSAVQTLFSYTAATSSDDLSLVSHGSSTYVGNFTMNVTADSSGNITGATATDANGNTTALTYSGHIISGATGSAYAGLQFSFSGTTSESISVTANQGIADKMYQISNQAADSNIGSVQQLVSTIQTQDATLQSQASDLQVQANTYYNHLLDYYGRLEASISQADQTATLLQSLLTFNNSSTG
jgi:flagellar hook-associated protein 2